MDGQKKFKEYLQEFEKQVIIAGFLSNSIGKKEEVVPLRPGKLAKTPLGTFIGKQFEFDRVLTINYYGLYVLSSKIYQIANKAKLIFPDILTIKSPIVYFNSLKIEDVKILAPSLVPEYEQFKNHIIKLRWKNEKTIHKTFCKGGISFPSGNHPHG